MKATARLFARALAGFGISVVAALYVATRQDAPGDGGSLPSGFLASLAALTAIALAGFAVGLAPLAFLRSPLRRPFLTGLGAGLFWLCLAIPGRPYSLGLTAPGGIGIVSVFIAVLVSGASIGHSFLDGGNGSAT